MPRIEIAPAGAPRHLAALRDLLERDYLGRLEWWDVLADIAASLKGVLDAQEALVAIHDPGTGSWEVVSSEGRIARDAAIAELGSRSVLDHVRTTAAPILTTGDQEIAIDSESIQAQQIEGVLAVPLLFRDVTRPDAGREVRGCLYAHRTLDRPPFSEADVAITMDVARLAEPTLTLLRHLHGVRSELARAASEVKELRALQARRYRIGAETRVPWSVFEPLSRLLENQKVTLLIVGPTGSGKSHLARAYHHACPRGDAPFVVLDCGSVTSAETLGAELFGYAASSGYANAPRHGSTGKARLAHGGSLFIDEVANLALELQPKLLRLIQEGRFAPLGASADERVDIQILAATNADLERRVEEGSFREDLYHRLNVVRVELPGLGARPEDVPDIAAALLARVAEEAGRTMEGLTDEAMEQLVSHDWTREGNIRGLENLIRRSVWAAPRDATRLEARHLRFVPPSARTAAASPAAAPAPPRFTREDPDLAGVKEAIRRHRNAKEAAAALGITYRQLYWKLQRAGLSVRDVLAGRD